MFVKEREARIAAENRLAEERRSKDELLEKRRAERQQWQEQLAEERRRADKGQRVLLTTIAGLVTHENGNGSPIQP